MKLTDKQREALVALRDVMDDHGFDIRDGHAFFYESGLHVDLTGQYDLIDSARIHLLLKQDKS